MMESTVTSKGQTTIPQKVRKALNVKPRQRIAWEIKPDGTALVRPEASALALFGSLKSKKAFPGIKAEQQNTRRAVAEKHTQNK
jgi:antitoxin PrlF